jgi:hypothetical protein
MARLIRPVRPSNNITEYKGCLIEAVEQQGFYVTYVTIDSTRRRARNMEHALQMVDVSQPVTKEVELHPGGWIKNPPVHCEHTRIDREGLWAECVMCAFFCMNAECSAYILVMGNKRKKEVAIIEVNVVPETIVETPRINRRRRN